MAKRGRPRSIAREVPDATGLSLRTVQRALAEKPARSPEEITVERLVTVMRNCATFCRENSWGDVFGLPISAERGDRLNRDLDIIEQWLAESRLPQPNGEPS